MKNNNHLELKTEMNEQDEDNLSKGLYNISLNEKHSKGQYFTTNQDLKNKVLEFICNNPENILEPSIGQGDLIEVICHKYPYVNFDMYEIDENIKLLKAVPEHVVYGDFMKQQISKKYNTIVGNPPYVRLQHGNLYIDFTEKCYNLLDFNGELIFIVPSDFFKLTSSSKLLNEMLAKGTFTHIYHPNNENLFENASIDVIVYRYCKNPNLPKEVIYNGELLHITNNNGLITFNKNRNTSSALFMDYFDIYVGLVNGKESVFKNEELGNVDILNGEDKIDKYIFIEKYPCEDKNINEYLQSHKDTLITRKIKKFNEKNWFEWGAPRNIKSIEKNEGNECIYMYNLTRKEKVAFKGKVCKFGGGLIILIPRKKCNLDNIVQYLNSDEFKDNFLFSGRFKIGHRQISNSQIPSKCLN